jgi:hypothetical protein
MDRHGVRGGGHYSPVVGDVMGCFREATHGASILIGIVPVRSPFARMQIVRHSQNMASTGIRESYDGLLRPW